MRRHQGAAWANAVMLRGVKRMRGIASHALVATLAAVIAGGIAVAAIPGEDGTIHGCYGKLAGNLRVVDPAEGQDCTALEKPISWNQTGPPGPPGGATEPIGHFERLAFGELSEDDAPVLLMTVPGFGDVHLTACTEDGSVGMTFTNTGAEPILDSYGFGTIEPGARVSSESGLQLLMSIGEGVQSTVAQLGVNPFVNSEARTCALHGIALF